MNNKKLFFKTTNLGFVLGAVMLGALTEFVGHADAQNAGTVAQPPVVPPAVVSPDNYVYYPSYGVYFNSSQRQYAYLKGNAWVSSPEPFGVTAGVLQASPSVRMDFHDAPARHHAEMVQKYPKNWTAPGAHQERK